jgi:type II secretory pathway predicted ATPase ExeA
MGMAALDALAQRIVVRANLRGIARDEMGAYLAAATRRLSASSISRSLAARAGGRSVRSTGRAAA